MSVINIKQNCGERISSFSKVCSLCVHLNRADVSERKCSAFPDGIPLEIWKGGNDHTAPYKNDNGIRFEPIELPRAA